VNTTFPPQSLGFPPGTGFDLVGSQMNNGSVAGTFELETTVVSQLQSQTALGPGSNRHCSDSRAVSFEVEGGNGGQSVGGQIFNTPWGPEFGTGAPSDAGEPLEFNFTNTPGNATSLFRQGYTDSNSPPISTCGRSASSTIVRSYGLLTWIRPTRKPMGRSRPTFFRSPRCSATFSEPISAAGTSTTFLPRVDRAAGGPSRTRPARKSRADSPTTPARRTSAPRSAGLRRSFGRLADQAGVPVPTIQRIIGHVSIDQTLHYIWVGQEEVAEGSAVFDRHLASGLEGAN
jgi:hypothetical protein